MAIVLALSWKTIFPLSNCFCTFVRNQLAVLAWGYFWIVNFVSLIPPPIQYRLDYFSYKSLKRGDSSHFFSSLPKLSLTILVSSPFHINLRIILPISYWDFYNNWLNLCTSLRRTNIFVMLNLLIHKHGLSLHLLTQM